MKWLIENWYLIVAAIAAGFAVFFSVRKFWLLPKDEKIKNVKEWLRFAVAEAEKALGSGTGQLKLRHVYDAAIIRFPWIAECIKFETFSEWVDDALEWFSGQLQKNPNIKKAVEGSEDDNGN